MGWKSVAKICFPDAFSVPRLELTGDDMTDYALMGPTTLAVKMGVENIVPLVQDVLERFEMAYEYSAAASKVWEEAFCDVRRVSCVSAFVLGAV